MLRKFSEVLLQNSSKRALASLILTVSIEIAARRDTSSTHENKAVLGELLRIHDALTYSWDRVNKFCSPEAYAAAFDVYSSSLPSLLQRVLNARVQNFRVSIMADLEVPLFASHSKNAAKMEATEKMLVLVAA
jgi:hypothetical protein